MIGLKLSQEYLRSVIRKEAGECENEDIVCYLLDDAGFLIVSMDTQHEMEVSILKQRFSSYLFI